ncbi:MAG: iron-containing alcohol dehydrogenase [Suipraeoptans sp.]
MIDFTFINNPVQLYFGEGKLTEVVQTIRSYGTKALLVFGGSSFQKNGYYRSFVDSLAKGGVTAIDFGGHTYPSLAKVREGVALCRAERIDCIIGIGGGTCMDVAKAIAFATKQEEDIFRFLTYEISEEERSHLPVGSIVTYPSSGSEMNGAAQIDDDETRDKFGLSSVVPDFVWLNPAYTMSIDSTSLAYGQLTAFVQISSGFISLEKAELTETMTAALLKSVLKNLNRSISNSKDQEARSNLMLSTAMSMTGVSTFGKTGDWTLMPLTGLMQNYLNIPYTKALTIIFPHFLKDIYDGNRVFKAYFENVFGVSIDGKTDTEILEEGLNSLEDVYRRFGVAMTFRELTEVPTDHTALLDIVNNMGEMPSQYGVFTAERLMRILMDSIG